MIVNREELDELQGVTQKKLQELSKNGSADFSEKFVIQNIDSNITLVLNSDKGELIELGSRDKIIKDALLEYRADIAKIHSEIAFAGELSFYASQSLVMLENMIQALPDDYTATVYHCVGDIRSASVAKQDIRRLRAESVDP